VDVSFTYRAQDGQGMYSDPATVTLFLHKVPMNEPPWPFYDLGTTDSFAVGDDPINQTVSPVAGGGWLLATLAVHPGLGKMKSFPYTGPFNFNPLLTDADGWFTYQLIGTDKKTTGTGKADLTAVNLKIFDGQDPADARRDEKEASFGAFTVANMNDTDCDSTPFTYDKIDYEDDVVKTGVGARGENEKDLMKVVVKKPTGFGASLMMHLGPP
jgi:hypothetical protein